MGQCLEIWSFIIALVLVLFNLAMVIAILAKNYGSGTASANGIEGGVLGVHQNIASMPFSDILLGTSCPSGYEQLTLGSWPGTVPFCYSLGQISLHGKCAANAAIDSQAYTSWKNSSVCVKRVTGFSNSTSCPSGYTECYAGVCIEGTQCAITEIHIESSARTGAGWYTNTYGSTSYINYRKDSGVLPIATLDTSQGGASFCVNSYEYASQNNYDAIAIKGKGCGSYGSFPGVISLDSDNSLDIFYCQGWNPSPVSLPLFTDEIGSTQLGYLLTVPRLEIADNEVCTTLDTQQMLDRAQDLQSSRNVSGGIAIAIISIIGALIILGVFTACLMKNLECLVICYAVTSGLLTLVIGILLIAAAAVTGTRQSSLSSYKSTISSAIAYNCFTDMNVQQLLADFVATSNSVGQVATLWMAYAIIWWSLFILLIAALIASKRKQ